MRVLSSGPHEASTSPRHRGRVLANPVWRVVLGLLVVLPMVAYVAGTLAGPGAPEPTPRDPVVLRDAPVAQEEQEPRRDRERRRPRPGDQDARGDDRDDDPDDGGGSDDGDDDGDDDVTDDRVDDNGVRVVVPEPTRVDGGGTSGPSGPTPTGGGTRDDDTRDGPDDDDEVDDDGDDDERDDD